MQRQPHNSLTLPPLPPLPKGARRARRAVRSGFTLVEMMVVIVIIAVLMGLAIPTYQTVRIKANESKVVAEIKGLESAIAAFKSKYGSEPPSKFILYLTQPGWASDPTNRAIVRQIWGQFDFTMGDPVNLSTGGAGTAYPGFWKTIAKPVTTNGVTSPALSMNSGECMLFFLGGVIDRQGIGQIPTGFSTNKLMPFAPPIANSNREGPFFGGFSDVSRIKDVDQNGINEWYDSIPNQTLPYLYFSSYEGRGYNLSDLPVTTAGAYLFLHDIYRASSTAAAAPASPSSSTNNTSAALNGVPNSNPQNPQTCQIISPGYDMDFGYGGVFNPNLPNAGLQINPTTKLYPDADNLTNFNSGRLKP